MPVIEYVTRQQAVADLATPEQWHRLDECK